MTASSMAERLRAQFDESFARIPEGQPDFESFLGLELRGAPFALRLRQIESLLADRRIVPLPTSTNAFAGLVAHRGSLVAVYDLGILLGYTAAASALRWLVTVRTSGALVALAFDGFHGHYRVAALPRPHESGPLSFVPGLPDGRPVIDVHSILEPIFSTKGASTP